MSKKQPLKTLEDIKFLDWLDDQELKFLRKLKEVNSLKGMYRSIASDLFLEWFNEFLESTPNHPNIVELRETYNLLKDRNEILRLPDSAINILLDKEALDYLEWLWLKYYNGYFVSMDDWNKNLSNSIRNADSDQDFCDFALTPHMKDVKIYKLWNKNWIVWKYESKEYLMFIIDEKWEIQSTKDFDIIWMFDRSKNNEPSKDKWKSLLSIRWIKADSGSVSPDKYIWYNRIRYNNKFKVFVWEYDSKLIDRTNDISWSDIARNNNITKHNHTRNGDSVDLMDPFFWDVIEKVQIQDMAHINEDIDDDALVKDVLELVNDDIKDTYMDIISKFSHEYKIESHIALLEIAISSIIQELNKIADMESRNIMRIRLYEIKNMMNQLRMAIFSLDGTSLESSIHDIKKNIDEIVDKSISWKIFAILRLIDAERWSWNREILHNFRDNPIFRRSEIFADCIVLTSISSPWYLETTVMEKVRNSDKVTRYLNFMVYGETDIDVFGQAIQEFTDTNQHTLKERLLEIWKMWKFWQNDDKVIDVMSYLFAQWFISADYYFNFFEHSDILYKNIWSFLRFLSKIIEFGLIQKPNLIDRFKRLIDIVRKNIRPMKSIVFKQFTLLVNLSYKYPFLLGLFDDKVRAIVDYDNRTFVELSALAYANNVQYRWKSLTDMMLQKIDINLDIINGYIWNKINITWDTMNSLIDKFDKLCKSKGLDKRIWLSIYVLVRDNQDIQKKIFDMNKDRIVDDIDQFINLVYLIKYYPELNNYLKDNINLDDFYDMNWHDLVSLVKNADGNEEILDMIFNCLWNDYQLYSANVFCCLMDELYSNDKYIQKLLGFRSDLKIDRIIHENRSFRTEFINMINKIKNNVDLVNKVLDRFDMVEFDEYIVAEMFILFQQDADIVARIIRKTKNLLFKDKKIYELLIHKIKVEEVNKIVMWLYIWLLEWGM